MSLSRTDGMTLNGTVGCVFERERWVSLRRTVGCVFESYRWVCLNKTDGWLYKSASKSQGYPGVSLSPYQQALIVVLLCSKQ